MLRKPVVLMVAFVLIALPVSAQDNPHQSPVTIQIDGSQRYQTFEGFGASFTPFEWEGVFYRHDPSQPESVTVTPEQKAELATILYTELGINRTRFILSGFEPTNDNDDPFTFNPAAFDWAASRVDANAEFLLMGQAVGLENGWLSFAFDNSHQDAWRQLAGNSCALDPTQIDEEVEWLLAAVLHFRDLGINLRYMAINNEPDLCPPGYKIEITDFVTIVERLGSRLREEGLETQIVVSDGWIPQNAILYMRATLEDAEARQYVGALAFHAYDGYDNIDMLLSSDAEGNPPHDPARVREEIRDLAAQYNLPVWTTEVCYCMPRGRGYFDLARGRLNHLMDELTITNASAFDGMNVAFIERPEVGDEFVHYYFQPDGTYDHAEISTYGYLIGHFSRYVPSGSLRIQTTSMDSRVRVVAFERPDGKLVVVILNNNDSAVDVQLEISDFDSAAQFVTLSSREGALWQAGHSMAVTDTLRLEPLSITTLLSQ